MWNRTDNKTPKEKMQFIVDQCAKLYDMEVRDREYGKEIKKRGRIRPGTFEGWKKVKIFFDKYFLNANL